MKTSVLPLECEISELVKFLPYFLNLLSVTQDLNLVVMDVEHHLLVISVVVCTQLVVTGLQSSYAVFMVIYTLR